jgi:hypothetical protein
MSAFLSIVITVVRLAPTAERITHSTGLLTTMRYRKAFLLNYPNQ